MTTTEHPPAIGVLAKRRPQNSREARMDRTLRISGTLDKPKAEGCTDVELMGRVLDALEDL